MLSNAASTSQSLSAISIEENTKAESFLSGETSGSLFQNCQIATVNVQIHQSGRTEKSSKICCEKKLKITLLYKHQCFIRISVTEKIHTFSHVKLR